MRDRDDLPEPASWINSRHPQNITLKVSGYSDEQIAYIMELEEQADSLKVLLAVVMTMLGAGGLVAYAAYKVGLIAVVL